MDPAVPVDLVQPERVGMEVCVTDLDRSGSVWKRVGWGRREANSELLPRGMSLI